MRLYLSSYGLDNQPQAMLPLIGENKSTAVIMNATDSQDLQLRQLKLQ